MAENKMLAENTVVVILAAGKGKFESNLSQS